MITDFTSGIYILSLPFKLILSMSQQWKVRGITYFIIFNFLEDVSVTYILSVPAIAWSPHHHGLLASGGGTADRCIRFWNTLTGQPMQSIDTSSQVCNLAWSKHSSELVCVEYMLKLLMLVKVFAYLWGNNLHPFLLQVSTHGYSQNQILVWKYPSLSQVAKLTGHSTRVLYLAMSPDGEAIVTGAGDETLRFWNVFSKTRSQKVSVVLKCALWNFLTLWCLIFH